ncbi:MAG TPA: rhomboid family intramembrane serine protease [Acidimicrobiales bacterium]|nr:rhomboid family intramembrane serine protease [Acidimicrobiales bacterium]
MIPLKDENPTTRAPIVTIVLIAACVAIFAFVQPRDQGVEDATFSFKHAAIPCEVVNGRPLTVEEVRQTVQVGDGTSCQAQPFGRSLFSGKSVFLAVLYSMFLHGSWLHLGGNMLFLWIFGNNIEDKKGHVVYLVFYLAAGLAATAAHILVQPDSTLPVVGASGAIAGVMGAYLVLYPNVRIRSLIFLGFFVLFRDVAAKWLLGIWLISQFFISPSSGVAWMAHVGGFVFGVAVGLVWRAAGTTERQLETTSWPRY